MIECSAGIAAACVYPGRTQIVRRGCVDLLAGPGEIILLNISAFALQIEALNHRPKVLAGMGTAERMPGASPAARPT